MAPRVNARLAWDGSDASQDRRPQMRRRSHEPRRRTVPGPLAASRSRTFVGSGREGGTSRDGLVSRDCEPGRYGRRRRRVSAARRRPTRHAGPRDSAAPMHPGDATSHLGTAAGRRGVRAARPFRTDDRRGGTAGRPRGRVVRGTPVPVDTTSSAAPPDRSSSGPHRWRGGCAAGATPRCAKPRTRSTRGRTGCRPSGLRRRGPPRCADGRGRRARRTDATCGERIHHGDRPAASAHRRGARPSTGRSPDPSTRTGTRTNASVATS